MLQAKQQPLIILFGSQVNGHARKMSDFDAAVLDNHELSLKEKIKLGEYIAEKLKITEDKLDLVDLWRASPLLQYQVSSQGKLLEGDKSDFNRFKILAWKRYLNTAKLRRAREESLKKQYAR